MLETAIENFKLSLQQNSTVQNWGYQWEILTRRWQLPILQEIDRLRSSPRYQDPKHLIPYGHKTYSQSDEDGIIREIFRRIGTTNKTFGFIVFLRIFKFLLNFTFFGKKIKN